MKAVDEYLGLLGRIDSLNPAECARLNVAREEIGRSLDQQREDDELLRLLARDEAEAAKLPAFAAELPRMQRHDHSAEAEIEWLAARERAMQASERLLGLRARVQAIRDEAAAGGGSV